LPPSADCTISLLLLLLLSILLLSSLSFRDDLEVSVLERGSEEEEEEEEERPGRADCCEPVILDFIIN
jgi:hypothetical protein